MFQLRMSVNSWLWCATVFVNISSRDQKGRLQMINAKDYGLSNQEVQYIIEQLNSRA